MTKIINTIKKSFVYIVGFILFIIAMYVMLIPPNSKLINNKNGLVEAFTGFPNYMTSVYDKITKVTNSSMDSITAYRNIVGQNLNNVSVFDTYLKSNITIMPDNNKALVLSRCYQMPFNTEFIKQINSNKDINPGIFYSYTERYDCPQITDFGDIIRKKIVPSINLFSQTLTNNSISTDNSINKNILSNKNINIDGDIYVLVLQYPIFKDNSTDPETNITINSSILPQSKSNPNSDATYYSPSYIAPISNREKSKKLTVTTTPIDYLIFIIYDDYLNGPINSSSNIKKNVNSKFSNTLKQTLDKTSLSTAEQCFIGGMGAGGLNYIGGCASLGGVIAPNNAPFCESQIPGDESPWSYLILYTVNKKELGQSSSAM